MVTAEGCEVMGTALRYLERYEEAVAYVDRGISIVGNDPRQRQELLHEKSRIYGDMCSGAFQAKDFHKSLEYITVAINICPSDPSLFFSRAVVKRSLKEFASALNDIEQAIRINATSMYHSMRGELLSDLKRYHDSIVAFNDAIELDPNPWSPDRALYLYGKAAANNTLGLEAHKSGSYDKAIELFTAAIDEVWRAEYLANRGCSKICKKMWQGGLEDANQSLTAEQSALGYRVKASALRGLGRFDEALRSFDAGFAIVAGSISETLLLHYGKAMAKMGAAGAGAAQAKGDDAYRVGEYEKAIDFYSEALSLDPSSSECYASRGAAKFSLCLWEAAAKDGEESIKILPSVRAHCIKAKAHRGAGRFEMAVESFEVAITEGSPESSHLSADTDTASTWSKLGETALTSHAYSDAEISFTSALAFDPRSSDLYSKRGHARILQQKWFDALHDAEMSPLGYRLQYEACNGAKLYDKAIVAFLDMSRMTEMEYVESQRAREVILSATDGIVLELPPRLFNTSSGFLSDKLAQIQTFISSDDYKQLLLSVITRQVEAPEEIRKKVKAYFEYAMLSHRWGPPGTEPLLGDITGEVFSLNQPEGIVKLQQFCRTVAKRGYKWAWSDTCCIDKGSSAEVQKSIASMVHWYSNSSLTIVYLSDVCDDSPQSLLRSVWFTRGWTLQELLAPRTILFYKANWSLLLCEKDDEDNHKTREDFLNVLSEATGIDKVSLCTFRPGLENVRVTLRWASSRTTTEEEDIAYCLMGVLDLHLPVIYGEKKKALGRLLQEVVGRSGDLSILQWSGRASPFSSCLPDEISSFKPAPWTPPALSIDVVRQSVADLRFKIPPELPIPALAAPAPAFVHGRLSLSCFIHRVKTLEVVSQCSEGPSYRIVADGLKPILHEDVDTLGPLVESHLLDIQPSQSYAVIRPWNPDYAEPLTQDAWNDRKIRALETLVQLQQPFFALLVARRKGGYYRRISGMIAQVDDIVQFAQGIRVERLDIF
ncbi:TPR-like protein [Gyrodon lividus]|nr:TPR-like protein [Gyrodon lividus]